MQGPSVPTPTIEIPAFRQLHHCQAILCELDSTLLYVGRVVCHHHHNALTFDRMQTSIDACILLLG